MPSRVFFVFALLSVNSAESACLDGSCAADAGSAGLSLLQNHAANNALRKASVNDEQDTIAAPASSIAAATTAAPAETAAPATTAAPTFDLPDIGEPPADVKGKKWGSFVEDDAEDDEVYDGEDEEDDAEDAEDDEDYDVEDDEDTAEDAEDDEDDAEDDAEPGAPKDEEVDLPDIGKPPADDQSSSLAKADKDTSEEASESDEKEKGGAPQKGGAFGLE